MNRFLTLLAGKANITNLRRDLYQAMTFLGLFCFILPTSMWAARPNILLMLTDDLGCADSSFSLRPVPFPTPSSLWPGQYRF